MNKHTPGPWRVYNKPLRRYLSNSRIIEIHAPNNVIVNWQGFDSLPGLKKQKLANARLIAAAPELLDGIRKARAVAASPQSFDLEEVERDFAALIAKAQGGQS